MDLVTFLRTCLDEDEHDIEASRMDDEPQWWMPSWLTRDRLLAEVAAKRRVIDLYEELNEPGLYEAVQALAAPYADRPDYDEAWRLA